MTKKRYNLAVTNLSPIELKGSRIPDSKINAIWASFTSISNRNYEAVHVYQHRRGPYILLCSQDKDKEDFDGVEKIVAVEIGGSIKGEVSDRGNDICDVIELSEKPTQARVADFVVGYFKHFKNVKIPVAYFRDVSEAIYRNSGFPIEKIKIEDYRTT